MRVIGKMIILNNLILTCLDTRQENKMLELIVKFNLLLNCVTDILIHFLDVGKYPHNIIFSVIAVDYSSLWNEIFYF